MQKPDEITDEQIGDAIRYVLDDDDMQQHLKKWNRDGLAAPIKGGQGRSVREVSDLGDFLWILVYVGLTALVAVLLS